MWPWEHLAVAYVLYSLLSRAIARESLSTGETIAVVAGSQLPDLVDKPLAWTVGVTETGYSVVHSAVVAPFVCLAAFALAARRGDRRLAGAFSFAYVSHLLTDVLNPIRTGRSPEPHVLGWPFVSSPAGDHGGFLDHVSLYFARYANELLAEGGSAELTLQVGLGAAVVALWVADGAPLASDGWSFLRRRLE